MPYTQRKVMEALHNLVRYGWLKMCSAGSEGLTDVSFRLDDLRVHPAAKPPELKGMRRLREQPTLSGVLQACYDRSSWMR